MFYKRGSVKSTYQQQTRVYEKTDAGQGIESGSTGSYYDVSFSCFYETYWKRNGLTIQRIDMTVKVICGVDSN